MTSELDAAVVKRTQSSLGKFVKRPALTEKLLRKPPFRFLHDIVHAIIREHGLLEGLYTADELNSDNIKDRDSKMAFLQKLIDVVKLTTGRELKVRPSKIVAGLEPERTNELLQTLASLLEQNQSTAAAVRQYLGDDPKVNPTAQNADANGVAPETNGNKAETREDKKQKHEKSKEKPKDPAIGDKRKDKNARVKEKDTAKNGAPPATQTDVKVEKGRTKPNGTKASNESKKKGDKSSKARPEKEKSLKRVPSTKEEQQLVAAVPEKMAPESERIPNGLETYQNGISHETRKRKDSLKEFGELVDVNGLDGGTGHGDDEFEKRKQPGSNGSSRRSSLKKQNSLTPSDNNALSDMNQFNGLQQQQSSPGPSRQDSGTIDQTLGPSHDDAPADQGTIGTAVTVTVAPPEQKSSIGKPPMHRQQSIETVMRPRTSLRPPSVRPPSARPGAPRRKEKNVEVILQPNETQKLGDINVKMEVFNSELLDDDGENLIVIEDPTAVGEMVYGGMGEPGGGGKPAEEANLMNQLQQNDQEEQQGHLVQQILETQKEFSSHTGTDSEMLRKADLEWSAKQRQSSAKEMDTLRDSIQKLTRSVNPLGKLMDFIQEDIDSMERELTSWQQTYTQSMVELNKERSATENAIEPLKQQLSQIEVNIREYREMIDTTRANILQNEQKIERLYMTEI
uniref:TRAF3-interacting protein 1 n=1 Tax=Anopheles farauti TaxID=69004 RepID=A0A1Y9H9J7_9DIPT